ncbi:hypothetical protein FHS78_000626 [Parvibaculum indicum]|uniref:phage major tropism determinant n=1 Tax=Parvibaculum indicum TaxID=562969 RepID=UPI00141F493A|nr:hypothetical protein [Parvibaculum indicum]NIJ40356.1 hypothetical protein [Parvibaculum indicum]
MDIALGLLSALQKTDPLKVCFSATAQAVSLNQDIRATVDGMLRKFVSGVAVVLPALTAGTDYAIYACSDGTLQASANFSAPAGYTNITSTRIGGFHYAPGGNAPAQAGGDTTPQINPYSLWDLKWRPACPDPRGMAFVADRFWCDIYLTGTDVDVNGSSRNGVTIADGSSPPKVPAMFGGNGSTAYGSLTWFEARELLNSVGKDLLDYGEFMAAAHGTTESVGRGNDPVSTGLGNSNAGSSNADEKFTSKWGIVQATGCMYVWGRDLISRLTVGATPVDAAALADDINAYSWKDSTEGRGKLYTQTTAGIAASRFGGYWANGSDCGSRASTWNNQPWNSNSVVGSRGRCDHLFNV